MRDPRASKGRHVAQTAASRAHVADIHLQAYPPKSRPTLAPSLTTTLIYTLGANTRRAARRNGERVLFSRSGRRMRLKLTPTECVFQPGPHLRGGRARVPHTERAHQHLFSLHFKRLHVRARFRNGCPRQRRQENGSGGRRIDDDHRWRDE